MLKAIYVGTVFNLIIIRVLPDSKVCFQRLRNHWYEIVEVLSLRSKDCLEVLAIVQAHLNYDTGVTGHLKQVREVGIVQVAELHRFGRFLHAIWFRLCLIRQSFIIGSCHILLVCISNRITVRLGWVFRCWINWLRLWLWSLIACGLVNFLKEPVILKGITHVHHKSLKILQLRSSIQHYSKGWPCVGWGIKDKLHVGLSRVHRVIS